MKYRDLIKSVEQDGWYWKRTKGSHKTYKHPIKPGSVTIAGQPGKDVPEGTRKSILKQAGLED